ncbi:MAG: hypothetical protein Q9220_003646 [cf. Caloplaca sp. 1 TL-2023]
MAEIAAGIAGLAAITGLLDVCCRLAGTIYRTASSIKDAPQSIQRLCQRSKDLGKLLQEVDCLVKRYATSSLAITDGFSAQAISAALEACRTELVEVETSLLAVRQTSGKLQDMRRRVKWIFDEPKVEQHCRDLDALSSRITTALSLTGRCHDIDSKNDQLRLRGQVNEIRDSLSTSMSQLHDDAKSTASIHRRNQQKVSKQLRKLNHGRQRLSILLSKISSLQVAQETANSSIDIARYSGLEAMAYILIDMRASLHEAVASMRSDSSSPISDEEIDFLMDEYERLIDFCKTSVDPPEWERSALPSDQYVVVAESQPFPATISRTRRCRRVYHNRHGSLEVQFEERIGHVQDRPTTIQHVTLRYLADTSSNVNGEGIYASFQKDMRMAQKPRVTRCLREVRTIQQGETYDQLITALNKDDLVTLQRMLSLGQIRPWDSYWDAQNDDCYFDLIEVGLSKGTGRGNVLNGGL